VALSQQAKGQGPTSGDESLLVVFGGCGELSPNVTHQAHDRHAPPATRRPHSAGSSSDSRDVQDKSRRNSSEQKSNAMAAQLLRQAARAGAGCRLPIATASRAFQTSAVLRQDAVIAPVKKPVGAFRGG
jgi:hypothetical protein